MCDIIPSSVKVKDRKENTARASYVQPPSRMIRQLLIMEFQTPETERVCIDRPNATCIAIMRHTST